MSSNTPIGKEYSNAELILSNTVRIETIKGNEVVGGGTGFVYYFFRNPETDESVQMIVTNKHVIKDMDECRFYFTQADEQGNALYGKTVFIDASLDNWIMHPNNEVDLCAYPLNIIRIGLENKGHKIFYVGFDSSSTLTNEDACDLSTIEDIIVIGYPNLIWDSVNNMPIVRKGVTATPLRFDYRGESKFLVDAAIFPGSSGSPVFIFNQGSFTQGGHLYAGNRTRLIGIIHKVYNNQSQGEIIFKEVPTALKPTSVIDTPNNLGIAIKALELHGFEPVLKDLISRNA